MAAWPYNTSAWSRLRLAKLAETPLCEICQRRGRPVQAKAVDHFLPIRQGGDPFPALSGLLSLCEPCHNEKSAGYDRDVPVAFRRRFAGCDADGTPVDPWDGWHTAHVAKAEPARRWSIPPMLAPSAVPVVLVAGPPGAGKSTLAERHAGPGDLVIDLDECLVQSGGDPWGWDGDRAAINRAYARRNAMLASLATRSGGLAFLIASAPLLAERDAWRAALRDLEVVVLAVPADECKRRIAADLRRGRHVPRQCRAVDDWWRRFTGREGAFKDGDCWPGRPMPPTRVDLL